MYSVTYYKYNMNKPPIFLRGGYNWPKILSNRENYIVII